MALDQDRLKQLLHYDHVSGSWTWLHRDGDDRETKRWNTRYAGKEAGRLDDEGYRIIYIDDMPFKAYRLAFLYMTGEWPPIMADHKDTNKSNDAWMNIRPATRSQNGANRGLFPNNTSGHKGVHWRAQRKKWQARIYVDGKLIYLGLHKEFSDACKAYRDGAIKYFGEYARFE